MKRILVACEESQLVAIEFRNKGFEAYSCDIIECSGGHPEWHIKEDVLPLLNGNCIFTTCDGVKHTVDGKWDAIIAFPPCTHLAVSGAAWFERKRNDGRQRFGIDFFGKIMNADCDKVVVENPVNIISGEYIKEFFPDLCEKYGFPIVPTQRIQPWMFGDNYSKNTCLWIKGLPQLVPSITEKPDMEYFYWTDKRTGKQKRQSKWYFDAFKLSPKERAKVRSKTFPGVAQTMVNQWIDFI